MKKYDVMYGVFGESVNIDSSFGRIWEANEQAKSVAEKIAEYGKHSKIKRTYEVYTEETVTDDEGEWVSSESPAGGFYRKVIGII